MNFKMCCNGKIVYKNDDKNILDILYLDVLDFMFLIKCIICF